MANIFKLRITRYVDAAGKRVSKGTPGAVIVREKSRKWYGEYRDSQQKTRRVALAVDKMVAQAKLNEFVRQVERRSAGLFDPFEEHGKKPLKEHFADYKGFARAKGNSDEHVKIAQARLRRLADGCGFEWLAQIEGPKVALWLANQRTTNKRFSAQTSNFYLDTFKYFCNWLVTHERLPRNPLATLKRVNIEVDRRHDRRSLGDDEFQRLLTAAEKGPSIQGLSGPDRAMLYLLASWTGFRRRELASLTLGSLDLDAKTPVLRLRAAYSKRRREDAVPLHAYLVERLRAWLATRPKSGTEQTLFALQTPSGEYRRTSIMMRKDLAAAREAWLAEDISVDERELRSKSGLLKYQNEAGLFADFHANRHTFISNLCRAGISLTVAQKLARHSDPRLTANRYTHLELDDQAAAISALPTPVRESFSHEALVPNTNPARKVKKSLVAVPVAGTIAPDCRPLAPSGTATQRRVSGSEPRKALSNKKLGAAWQPQSLSDTAHPAGLEPATPGSEDQCSIRLS